MSEKEGVLTVKNSEGELLAIVYNDMKKRVQTFFACKEMGMDEIKELLDNVCVGHCITSQSYNRVLVDPATTSSTE